MLNLSSFYQLKINHTKFTNCIMHQVDFTETEAKNVIFKDCDLKQSIFDHTNLEHSDFTSAYNFNINPSNNKIRQATFSKETIAGLLHDFNIKIIG